ncbi:microtubule-associated protein 10-like [Saccostrea echinata]|uniref:microtubule-associated protein 10-like n=1 Tax=Saccostrea echinata TaxID=191078 RepID=UPI002A826BFC|nr:microtubule-associated protein 10-like [Saccostrea echinata]
MDKESLFSLEVVVEKLYIPHTTCRFPSVVFRLLDFPNILIEHVEEDLARNIKYKITRDPYFKVPDQFAELKDKHGNFMIRKGKSCLFKVSPDTLKIHLSNTPLYVMVVDSFEKVPKLIGNSTLPLDDVMNQIVDDIKHNGNTVPSVHGDKGLFKIYSLMGKDIGYMVLGFRLLSLGPGLIPHIPDSAIAKQESNIITVKPTMEAVIKTPKEVPVREKNESLIETHEMGSMTEPEKQDVMLQTLDMMDKEIYVAISEPKVASKTEDKKEVQTMSTQTQKSRIYNKRKNREKNALDIEIESDDDEVIFTNIVQPPALFYNSENEPKVKIHRQYLYDDDESSVYSDELRLEDLSDGEKDKVDKEPIKPPPKISQVANVGLEPIRIQNPATDQIGMNILKDYASKMPNGPLFPILTALLKELSSLQDPQFVQQTVQQVQVATQHRQDPVRSVDIKEKQVQPEKEKFPAPKPQSMTKVFRSQASEENIQPVESKLEKQKSNLSKKESTDVAGKKSRGWIRKAPETSVKKSKLSYGLTNTQRLRLAKTNPAWLKNIEKEEAEIKAAKEKPVVKPNIEEDFPTADMSDTLTEVRRLAQKNLNADDTLAQSDLSTMRSTGRLKSSRKSRKYSPGRKRSKSPKQKDIRKSEKSKSAERRVKRSESSPHADDEGSESDGDAPSMPSQKSIEVRIPSVQFQYESDYTFNESDNAKEEKHPQSLFPGFADHNASLPESIDGNVNDSLNDKEDMDSPLESTRNEKPFENLRKAGSGIRSTDDFDTGTQFQSTEEPELQRLMSSGEEVSDVLSSNPTDQSKSPGPYGKEPANSKFAVLNPKSSLQSPIPALRRSHAKLERSAPMSPSRTPRSPSPALTNSSKFPTPRPRKLARERRMDFKQESLNTESVSSYFPSDGEGGGTDDDAPSRLSTPDINVKRYVPSTKLGYTIY